MDNGHGKADWAELSDEIWGLVFCCLKRDMVPDDEELTWCEYAESSLAAFLSFQSVCPRFRTVFEHTPSLISTVLIKHDVEPTDQPAMLGWLHKHGNAVQTLVAQCGTPWLDMALGCLLSSYAQTGVRSALTTAYFGTIAPATVKALGHFNGVTTLGLQVDCPALRQEVDLSPLQGLQHLTSLTLTCGHFFCLETLSHLTNLSVIASQVECEDDCQFVKTLQRLRVQHSIIERFHTNGVSACCSLTFLRLIDASITAAESAETLALRDHVQHVPQILSGLATLTDIHVVFVGDHVVQLPWLGQLTSLQKIYLEAGSCSLEFSQGVNRLKQLTRLKIIGGTIAFNFDWAELVVLQELSVQGPVRSYSNVLEIVKVKALRRVDLLECAPSASKQIELLAEILSAQRPDVESNIVLRIA